jgi:hypothetical protein
VDYYQADDVDYHYNSYDHDYTVGYDAKLISEPYSFTYTVSVIYTDCSLVSESVPESKSKSNLIG